MASQSSSSSDSMVSKIESAPEEFVRAVLIALCHKDSPKEKTMQYLETLESRQAEDDSSKKQSQRNKGKATSKLRICVQCEDTFREDENGPEDCPYHPGSLEVNDESEVWDDWEDWREGDPDSEENKEAYPEGYLWDCCKKIGDEEGCLLGFHKVVD